MTQAGSPRLTDIAGQRAIVTGGARGFGLGIARRLAAAGCGVVLWDRSFVGFDPDAAGFEPLSCEAVDVTDAAAVSSAFDRAVTQNGHVDILVNNAGINGPVLPSWEYPLEAWRQVLHIDLDGVFHGVPRGHSAHAPTRLRPHRQHRLYRRQGGQPVGCGLRCGQRRRDRVQQVRRQGIGGQRRPGELHRAGHGGDRLAQGDDPEWIAAMKAKIPMGRFLHVEEVAELVAWVASPACSFTTGFTFDLTGGRATYSTRGHPSVAPLPRKELPP